VKREREGASMRVLQIHPLFLLLIVSSLGFGFQAQQFTRADIEYELQLPSSAWRAVSRIDVHDHLEFVKEGDPFNGYLHLRKIVVDQPTTPSELFAREEQLALQHLPGYVVCNDGNGLRFGGNLGGAAFSYEYVSAGRTMYGRIYFLQLDGHTFYALRFTVAHDKLAALQNDMDVIARSFRLK
jgi:hypothetical protein